MRRRVRSARRAVTARSSCRAARCGARLPCGPPVPRGVWQRRAAAPCAGRVAVRGGPWGAGPRGAGPTGPAPRAPCAGSAATAPDPCPGCRPGGAGGRRRTGDRGAAPGRARPGPMRLVAQGPGDPAGQAQRRRPVLHVRPHTAAGQRPPQPERGLRLRPLHPFRRPVAGDPVLEPEDDRGRLVVTDEPVVRRVQLPRAAVRDTPAGRVLQPPHQHARQP